MTPAALATVIAAKNIVNQQAARAARSSWFWFLLVLLIVFFVVRYWVRRNRDNRGARGEFDGRDIDPNTNYDAVARRVYDSFVRNCGFLGCSGDEMASAVTLLMGLNDSEFILVSNNYFDNYGKEKGMTMRSTINDPVWLFSGERDAVNARFDRLLLS